MNIGNDTTKSSITTQHQQLHNQPTYTNGMFNFIKTFFINIIGIDA